MAAPTYFDSGAAVAATAAGSTVSWPASHQADDVAIYVVEHSGGAAIATTPSGWTALMNGVRDISTVAGSRSYVYARRAGGSSESAATLPFPSNSDHALGRIHVFRGVDPNIALGDLIVVTGGKGFNFGDSASTTATLPEVTTTSADNLIVLVCTRPNDDASTTHFGTPSNANLANINAGVESGTISGNGGGFVVAWGEKATAGATGTTTMSKAASTTDVYCVIALPPPADQTWTGSSATVTATATSGAFAPGGVTWTGNAAALTVTATSGTFAATATWAGSQATVAATATSGTFVPGAATWAGSAAAVTATADSGTFAPGAVTWTGSSATIAAAGTSGSFVPGTATWTGSAATVTALATAGTWGATSIWEGNTAAVSATATSGTFTPGDATWTGSTATASATGTSGTFQPGGAEWAGSPATAAATGVSGTFTPGDATWAGSQAAVAAAATSGVFTPGTATWTGESATVTALATSGEWIAGAATWAGSVATIEALATSGTFVAGLPPGVEIAGGGVMTMRADTDTITGSTDGSMAARSATGGLSMRQRHSGTLGTSGVSGALTMTEDD